MIGILTRVEDPEGSNKKQKKQKRLGNNQVEPVVDVLPATCLSFIDIIACQCPH